MFETADPQLKPRPASVRIELPSIRRRIAPSSSLPTVRVAVDRAAKPQMRSSKRFSGHSPDTDSSAGWCNVLRQTDFRIGVGESTAVVLDLRTDAVCGASVGDSQAWLISGEDITDLTLHQRRKPLLGSGEADPVGFSCGRLNELLIVATDGFCNYVKRDDGGQSGFRTSCFADLPRRLVNLVRLRSGALIDDVGIVVCRQAPTPLAVSEIGACTLWNARGMADRSSEHLASSTLYPVFELAIETRNRRLADPRMAGLSGCGSLVATKAWIRVSFGNFGRSNGLFLEPRIRAFVVVDEYFDRDDVGACSPTHSFTRTNAS